MKKLMIAAAIVCAAVISQAASIDWSVALQTAKGKNGSNMAVGTQFYLVLGGYESGIIDALNNGEFSASTTGVLDVGAVANKGGMPTSQPATSDLLKLGQETKTNFKLLLVDTTSVTGETWYRFSQALPEYPYDETAQSPTPTSITFTGTDMTAGTTWAKAEAVPEPTSGLLLLLGVAGLALRRRRA